MYTHLQCLNKIFHFIIPEQIFFELNFTGIFSCKMIKDCLHLFGDRNFSLFLVFPRKPTASWAASKDESLQVEGDDSSPLLWSCKTSPGVPGPGWSSQHKKDILLLERVQKRAADMIRELEPLLRGQAEKIDVFQSGEEEALGRP